MEGIKNIPVDELFQHPENPRKDLGDLAELAESIRKNGVMQNLTVIPGHWLTDGGWKEAIKKYKENPSGKTMGIVKEAIKKSKENTSEESMAFENGRWAPGGYTLLIGHRRCAAAKLAGLAELPCRVVEGMDRREQLTVMLEENMQRNDLTIWEQANGFQLMLDLGGTEEQIAEKTGFSKTTIRHRLNIAKLDQKELMKKEKQDGFQMTLNDLYALEKVEDIRTRNKILKEAGNSREIAAMAQRAVDEARRELEGLGFTHSMLVALHCAANDTDLVDWKGHYDKEKGERLGRCYDILKRYGWTFPDGDMERVLDGTHELYEKEDDGQG